MEAHSVILVYGMGITQHRRGSETVQQIANLALLRGNIGRSGAGLCPVRGHSNVQGDRTVGITEKPTPEFLDKLEWRFGFKPPRAHGHDVVLALEAMLRAEDESVHRAWRQFCRRGSPPHPLPSSDTPSRPNGAGLHQTQPKPSRNTASKALILPCLGRTEIDVQATGPQSITVEDSMSMVHASTGMNLRPSEYLKSELAIVAGLARATPGPTFEGRLGRFDRRL